jgi:hypothetical protein
LDSPDEGTRQSQGGINQDPPARESKENGGRLADAELVKKKHKRKRSSDSDIPEKSRNTFPTLGHIVLNNGLRVDIPELPTCTYPLTSYDHLRIALGHAAIPLSIARQADSRSVPKLMLSSDWDVIRLNLEDLLNHLHYAIRDFPKGVGSS